MLRVQIPSPALAGIGRLSYHWQSRFSERSNSLRGLPVSFSLL
jgi:hypothetical protein